jgi:hypothetical protein
MDEVKIGAIGAIVGAAGTVLTAVGIKMAGFTGTGVALGSLAAGIQSTIGNVVSGSLFAGLTSVGATGAILSAVPYVAIACFGIAIICYVGYKLWKKWKS